MEPNPVSLPWACLCAVDSALVRATIAAHYAGGHGTRHPDEPIPFRTASRTQPCLLNTCCSWRVPRSKPNPPTQANPKISQRLPNRFKGLKSYTSRETSTISHFLEIEEYPLNAPAVGYKSSASSALKGARASALVTTL
jgi:hypothetical protein